MSTRKPVIITLAILFAIVVRLAVTPSAQSPTFYRVTDLGTLNGNFCSGFVGRNSFATALNDNGVAVGGSCAVAGFFQPVTHAFSWSGVMIDLGTLGLGDDRSPDQSIANAINNSGQIVGRDFINDGGGTGGIAFLWSAGTMTRLDTVLGGDFSSALGINNAGQIVGLRGALPDTSSWSAFFYDTVSGQVMSLPGLAGTFRTAAVAINDAGDVAGYATAALNVFHAVRWRNQTPTDLGTLGGTHSFASAINRAGDVVGQSLMPGDADSHAFVSRAAGSTMQDLGTLGGSFSYANGINDSGQIVGTAGTAMNGGHAFVSDGVMMADLNDLISAAPGWVLLEATAINASGAIVGTGRINNESHAFLLTPSSPPIDTLPPVLTVPADFTVGSPDSQGTTVFYFVTATDDVDPQPTVTCLPPSGSVFPVGTTTVECTARDNTGKISTASFRVTVVPPLDVSVELAAKGVVDIKSGIATVGGTVACNRQTTVFISGQLTELVAHRATLLGSFSTSVACAGPSTAWTATAAGFNGGFGAGPASISAGGFACDFSCDSDQKTQSVLLVGRR